MFDYKYSVPSNEPASKMDLKFYCCGTDGCEQGYSWGPAVKDHYKLHYVHSGKGILRIENETYKINAGQVFLIPPNIISYYQSDEEEPWCYYWAAFNGANAQSYLRRANLSNSNPVVNCDKDGLIVECFNQMFEGSQMKNSGDMRLLSYLYMFFAILIEYSSTDQGKRKVTGQNNIYIAKAIDLIESNYSGNINISEIADLLGLNRKYFSRIFKESVGISPQNFLIEFRLNKACDLMKNSSLSVGEISRSIGYDDQLLFSKVFKKFKGVSPSIYRKNKQIV
jgi:AraC-like DNA-binding protein